MPKQYIFFPPLTRRTKYSVQPRYNKYRNEIRQDCQFRCVYCDIHELELRDERMELDHFRPQSLFPKLWNTPSNLVLSCPTCNRKKDDDWPAYGKPNGACVDGRHGYIDPFNDDRTQYFQVQSDGSFLAIKDPADYMIRTLLLNRPLIKSVRRKRLLIHKYLEELHNYFNLETEKVEKSLVSVGLNAEAKKEYLKKLASLKAMRITVEGLERLLELD